MPKQKNTIPKGWKEVKISEICKVVSGSTPKTSVSKYWGGDLLWVTPYDLSRMKSKYITDTERKITQEGFQSCSVVKIPKGSLVMSSRAPIGYLAVTTQDTTTNQGCKSFICSNQVVVEYLYYYLAGYIGQVHRLGSGSTFTEVGKSALEQLTVFLPPFSQQQKIANILSSVDAEIEAVDKETAATGRLRRGLMQDLLTAGIGHKKFKKTELGEIPAEWEVVKLGDVARIERGKFSHRPRNNPKFYGGNIPFIQTSEVVGSNGKIDKYSQTLNKDGLAISRLFKKGTIIMTIAANIGDTGVLQFDSCFPDSLVGITIKDDMDNFFLEYYLRTRKNYLNSISTQSAQKNINLQKLEPLLVAKPKIMEQKKIAEILFSVDNKFLISKQLKQKLLRLKQGLMRDLLSGRVKV